MRLDNVRNLGLYVRNRRHQRGTTQVDLAASAQVSRRWLSDLEAGKPTVEVGLVFRVLHALDVVLDASPAQRAPDRVDLDEILQAGRLTGREADRD